PYRIGYSTVLALKELSINGYTSAYVDTGITVITGRNP
ncbi:MAG: sugar ABC transporter substrate-binding protein, partial [Spirochaetes bacterium]